MAETLIADLRARLNTATVGQRLPDAAQRVTELAASVPTDRPARRRGGASARWSRPVSDDRSDERVLVGGTANLARFGDDFDRSIRPLLEALEEHVVLLQLLGEADRPERRDGADRARGAATRS